MSRYLGPLWKKSRALNFSLLGNKKEFSRGKKRTTPPGVHGQKRKKRLSLYGLELQEKQKVMYGYGWRDKQLKNEYIKAKSEAGNAGTNTLIMSESRLDNVVFRSGLASTLLQARQFVVHKHILVDGKRVNIPSYKVKVGQIIILKTKKMKTNNHIKSNLEQNIKAPDYITFDKQKFTITCLRIPFYEDLPEEKLKKINPALVAKWYDGKV